MKTMCIALVAAGAAIMLIGITLYYRALQDIHAHKSMLKKSNAFISSHIYNASFAMMVFFLLGYVADAVFLGLSAEADSQTLLISVIFFFGAVFVLAMVVAVRRLFAMMSVESTTKRRLEQQQLMAAIAQSFISQDSTTTLVENALKRVGEFLDVSKIVISAVNVEEEVIRRRYGWCNAAHGEVAFGPNQIIRFRTGNIMHDMFVVRNAPYLTCEDTSSDSAFRYLQDFGVRSAVLVPMFVSGRYWGTLTVDDCQTNRHWEDSDIQLVRLIASVISELVTRSETEGALVAAKDQAEQASRAKSEFLSRMSHEMRTPMNAIIGMTGIGKNAADTARKDYCLHKIDSASKHLLGVINDVLDVSKIEAGKLELSYADFPIGKMLGTVTNVIQHRVDEKKQSFTINVAPDVPAAIVSDEQRLNQVIANLLSNAVKFTPENGSIALSLALDGEENGMCTLRFAVKDSGIGISQEQQERLFHSFEQADGSVSRKFGGTGLGLVISKRIVEMMDGKIWIESELNKGASFIFTISAARSAQTFIESEPAAGDELPEDGMFEGHTILMAEDVEVNREIILAMFEHTGIQIDCAENGREALERFAADMKRYELILMDIQMPEMSGYEAAQAIRALDDMHAKTIPILAMTANVFREDIEKCLASGMDGHVGKPIDPDDVTTKLKHYLLPQLS